MDSVFLPDSEVVWVIAACFHQNRHFLAFSEVSEKFRQLLEKGIQNARAEALSAHSVPWPVHFFAPSWSGAQPTSGVSC